MNDATAYALVMTYPGLNIRIESDGTWSATGPQEGVTAALNAAS